MNSQINNFLDIGVSLNVPIAGYFESYKDRYSETYIDRKLKI